MPYSTPATVSDGNVAPATWGNSVKAATDFLANPPSCRVYNSAALSIPTGAGAPGTQLTYNSERWDTDNMHSTVSLTGRIVINTAGLYVVGSQVQFPTNGVGERWMQIKKNGSDQLAFESTASASITVDVGITYEVTEKFIIGDFIEVFVAQTSGGALNAQPSSASQRVMEFWATWIGLG